MTQQQQTDAASQPAPEDEGVLVAARRAKLEEMRARMGIEPYGRRVDGLESCAAARARFDEAAHAAFEAGQAARKTVREREEDNLKTMQGAGVAITRPSVAPFRDKMGPAYDVLRKSLGDETWTAWTGMVNAARG